MRKQILVYNMSLNTTHATGNTSLSYNATTGNISSHAHSWEYAPVNNLGYGLGKIVREAFDQLWHVWQKMWASRPSSEELATRQQLIIYRQGLKECVMRLEWALDDVRKNPNDPSKLKKIESLASRYALF